MGRTRFLDRLVESKLMLPPLAGYTDPPFRTILAKYDPPFIVTEMINATAIIHRGAKTLRMMEKPVGTCLNGVQLVGSEPFIMGEAAAVVGGRQVAGSVRAMVVPGSQEVKAEAEAEGLDGVFRAAGFEWREAGCSMCLGMNPDTLAEGERCASTSNRNFEGRQGAGGRTHLVSPPMAAAAALAAARRPGGGEQQALLPVRPCRLLCPACLALSFSPGFPFSPIFPQGE